MINNIKAQNAKYNKDGSIDLIIAHPTLGAIPFTASKDDIEEYGRVIYNSAINGEYGDIAPYVEPEIPNFLLVPQTISLRQAREILIVKGLFEQVQSYIESIEDPTQKAIILNYWEYSTVFERRNPTVLQMSEMLGLSSEQLDELFIEASKL